MFIKLEELCDIVLNFHEPNSKAIKSSQIWRLWRPLSKRWLALVRGPLHLAMACVNLV